MSKGEKLYQWSEKKIQSEITTDTNKILDQDPMQQFINEQDESMMNDDAPILQDKRVNVSKNMPKKLPFRNRAQMLLNNEYTYQSGKTQKKSTKKTKNKGSMRNLVNSLMTLDNLLNETVNLENWDQLRNAFLTVCRDCETYISKHNPWSAEGKARKQIVQDFYDQVSWESMRIGEIIKDYKAHPDQLDKEANWAFLLEEVRVETYEDGKDGVQVTMGGVGTSDLYIVEKDGQKKYFKESEDLPPYDADTLFEKEKEKLHEKVKQIKGTQEEIKKQKQQLTRRFDMLKESQRILKEHSGNITVDIQTQDSSDQLMTELLQPVLDKTCKQLNAAFNEMTELENKKSELEEQLETETEERTRTGQQKSENEKRLEKEIQEIQKKIDESDYIYLQNALWSIRKGLQLNAIATDDAKIDVGENISKRNAATYRLAEILGIGDMVVPSKMTDVVIGGKKMRGVMMDEAKGKYLNVQYDQANKENVDFGYSPNALKQVMSLQVFDLLCGQVDRNGANYLWETDHDENNNLQVTKLKAIDNDVCFGNLSYKTICKTGKQGINRMRNIEIDGRFTLPALDFNLANQILALQPEILDFQMVDLLNKTERKFLIDRLKGIQKAIRAQMNYEKKQADQHKPVQSRFLKTEAEWGNKYKEIKNQLKKRTMEEEKTEERKLQQVSYLRKYAFRI